MARGLALIDGNNIAYAAQTSTRLHAGSMETQSVFGFLRSLRLVTTTYPGLKPIVLWDGRSWRKDVSTTYKANRDTIRYKSDVNKQRNRQSVHEQQPYIKTALRSLAVSQMWAANMEADDLAGILVERVNGAKPVMLITADKDWIQLVGKRTGWFDPIRNRHVTLANFEEETGYENAFAFLQGKALQGDASDEIPGVGGIGEKGAKDILARFSGVKHMLQEWDEYGDVDRWPKRWRDFAADPAKRSQFDTNIELMNLRDPVSRPAPTKMKIESGQYDVRAFNDLCEELGFRTITNRLYEWLEPFMPKEMRDAA